MNLRKLERFLEIARAGSLSRAAAHLDVSQPALSRELRELETEFGLPLLRRHARGISLTAAGEVLRQKAETLLSTVENLKDEVAAATNTPAGRLAYGMPQSMGSMLTGPLAEHFMRHYPAVRLHVREAMSTQLRDALLAREIDVAVLSAPVSDGQLVTRPLLVEPMVLVGPKGCGLSPRKPVEIEYVAGLPLIAPAFPHTARLLVESAMQSIGRRPIVAMETDSAPIADLVMRGLGYAVLPSCAVSSHAMVGSAMSYAPIRGLSITWVVACPAGLVLSLAATRLYQTLYELTREAIAAKRWNAEYLGPGAGLAQAPA